MKYHETCPELFHEFKIFFSPTCTVYASIINALAHNILHLRSVYSILTIQSIELPFVVQAFMQYDYTCSSNKGPHALCTSDPPFAVVVRMSVTSTKEQYTKALPSLFLSFIKTKIPHDRKGTVIRCGLQYHYQGVIRQQYCPIMLFFLNFRASFKFNQ